jgi:hypothetical protein
LMDSSLYYKIQQNHRNENFPILLGDNDDGKDISFST